MVSKERSPFTPGRPVPIEYFVGRLPEIQRVERAIKQAKTGRNENVFITGERGLGKSSLADFVQFVASKEYLFAAAHCYLGPVQTLDQACAVMIQKLVEQMPSPSLVDKARGVFGKYIKSVDAGLFSVSLKVQFTDDEKELRELRLNFLPSLLHLCDSLTPERHGLMLILDDVNGIAKNADFAHSIKSSIDSLASEANRRAVPLVIALVGVQERMDDLASNQPSIPRIFDVIELTPMTKEESSDFLKKAFQSVNVTIDDSVADSLGEYSGGIPVLLHEIGDATYWEDKDNGIDDDDALGGLIEAADRVGKKYLDRQVYQALRSGAYRSMLRKIATYPGKTLKRTEIRGVLGEGEMRNFDNFRGRMERLDMLRLGDERGTYVFANELFRLYFRLEAWRAEREAKSKVGPGSRN